MSIGRRHNLRARQDVLIMYARTRTLLVAGF